jgi:hypothetical protein
MLPPVAPLEDELVGADDVTGVEELVNTRELDQELVAEVLVAHAQSVTRETSNVYKTHQWYARSENLPCCLKTPVLAVLTT